MVEPAALSVMHPGIENLMDSPCRADILQWIHVRQDVHFLAGTFVIDWTGYRWGMAPDSRTRRCRDPIISYWSAATLIGGTPSFWIASLNIDTPPFLM